MALQPINLLNLGSAGLVPDGLPWELPLSAFTNGRNVRFTNREVSKLQGFAQVYGTLPIAARSVFAMRGIGNMLLFVVPGDNKVYALHDGLNVWTNITRQSAFVDVDYTATASDAWNGGMLNGVFVCNNGVDVPQMWNPSNTSTRLADLTAWPSALRARVVKPFKYWLVALDITDAGVEHPYRIRWSASAEPGALPASWDNTDPTLDAGERDLAKDAGRMFDLVELGDSAYIYRSGSVWRMTWINDNDVFSTEQVFSSFGALSQDCALTLNGKHIVLTDGDVLQHNGYEAESIVDGRIRRWLFNNISTTTYSKAHLVRNDAKSEVWICIPTGNTLDCDKAVVWNWRYNTFTVIDLPHVLMSTLERPTVDATLLSWDAAISTWDTSIRSWDESGVSPSAKQVVSVDTSNRLCVWDYTEQAAGVDFTAYVEKTGITWGDDKGQPDLYSWKLLRNVWLRVDGTEGGQLAVEIGTQEIPTGPISWEPAQTWTIGTTQKLDMLLSGRLFAIRIRSTTNISWRLQGAQFDVKRSGRA